MTVPSLLALFGAGIASFLAPCVVPLLPAYLGMLAGGIPADRPGATVRATAAFVAGFSAVFVVFGAIAGWLGSSLDDVQGWVQRLGGLLVIGFGLVLLGVIRGRALREFRPVRPRPDAASDVRAVVMGVAFGAAWTPCVGPLLGAALVVAARSQAAGSGALLLGAYALGVGVPFVAASLTLASLPRVGVALRRIAPVVERVAGVGLVALGLLLVTDRYGWVTSVLGRLVPSVSLG